MAEPKELGTLIVVVGKARNLPNKSRFGKQDPFCTLTINEEKQKTKAIKRGGQHPEWDEEFRFSIMEDVDDILTRSDSQTDTSLSLSTSTSQVGGSLKDSQSGAVTPAALANKSRKGPIHKKGGKSMRVSCFADDAKEPELIGECVVDIEEALKKGEVDEWYEFLHKEKYSGEIYLELTFYSNDVPPVKRNVPRPTVHNYGGIGSYDPASSSSSSSINRNRLSGGLAASGSVSGMSLYIPPYAQPARAPSPAQTIVPSGSFADLGLPPGHARKQSLPVPMAGQPGYPVSSLSSHPTLNSMATLDSLTRPMSSLSIGTSYSSRPLPPASPAPPEPPRNPQHSYGHRHSVGGPGDAPWGSLLPQNQPPPAPVPHPRPVSSNDALQWQQVQRIEDERRRGGATPIQRPSSGQGYAPPNQSYPYQQPYPAPRAPSPVPSSLMPAGPPQLPAHANSFSAATSGYQSSYLSPSPAPAPPVHPASAPPESHYSTPSSSYPHVAQAPSEPFRAPSPRPGYQPQDAARPAYDVYGGDPNGYGGPPISEAYPGRQPSPQPPSQPYQPAFPSQSAAGQPYAPAGSQYPGYAPTVPTLPSNQDFSPPRGSTPTPGGYVPWYQQTASTNQQQPNQPNGRDGYGQPINIQPNPYGSPPPPVPSHRPVPHPPVPPKQSVGYYPSDELYALQRQQTPAPQQGQQQFEYQPPQSYTPAPPQPPPQSYTPAPQPPPHSYTPAPSQSYPSAPAHSYNPATQQAPQHYPTAPFSPTNPPTSSMPFSQPPAQPSHSHSNSYSGRAPNGWHPAVPESYARPSPDPARAPSPVPPPPPKSSAPEGWQSTSTLPPPSQPLANPNGRSPSPSPQVKTDWRSYMSNLPVNGRSPSPQPPNHQRQEEQREWYTPPPSLPASIRPPEGWRSTLPGQVSPNGHQWRG
ncbi:hypothetical protein BCR39DRAFT_511825 [Naematelia encephala]|uniref:C2 domain-containing protein n=1 Tax=Naematelia encephala TaxID=71784 RepID=A0A1Y2BNJ6_9TREE|nr:hypothetical protein BCR39DRAFT_511825 [Naematelia encephala]